MALMAAIAIGLVASPVFAQSMFFFGEIGGAPVFVSLERDGEKLSGWYVYVRQAKSIRLEGKIDGGGLAMDEFSYENGAKTGAFRGLASPAGWSGAWQSPDGRGARFSLRPQHGTLSDLSGRLRCKASKLDSDYTFAQSLDLRARAGRISRFSYANEATSKHDEQSCSVDLGELEQIDSDSGVLLRARGDDPNDTSPDTMHCSVRVLGDSDHLVIRVEGCKGAGDTMFCSARGGWTDLVVNRKTQVCKAIE
jgi:hypothetical protein